MRNVAHSQLEGFLPKVELCTVYVEHDIDASEAVHFVCCDAILQGTQNLASITHCGPQPVIEGLY